MKLAAFVLVVSAVAVTGCATTPTPPATSTTRITSAEVTVAEDAPRVGKQQSTPRGASAPPTPLTLAESEREKPSRDGRRTGGGFSGYK